MKNLRFFYRVAVLWSVVGIMLSECLMPLCVYAARAGVDVDETLYLNMDPYGDVSEANIVKGLTFHTRESYTDYGDYLKITNMSTDEEPRMGQGSVTWSAPKNGSIFFFEGQMDPKKIEIPWTFDITYRLNGVITDAEHMAGASGLVEIDIDAYPNEKASEYMRNNFMLLVAMPMDMSKFYSVDAPGSQTASIGEYMGVVFEALPGKEGHFVVRVGTERFETIGLVITMAPATVGDLQEIKDLRELKDKFRDNTGSMLDDVEALMDNVADMSNQLSLTNQMLLELKEGKSKIDASKNIIFDENDAAIQDLRALSGTLTPLDESLKTAQWMIYESNKSLNALNQDLLDTSAKMQTLSSRLKELGSSMGGVDNLTAQEINGELVILSGQLGKLKGEMGDIAMASLLPAGSKAIGQLEDYYTATASDIVWDFSELYYEEGLTPRQIKLLNQYIAGSAEDLSSYNEEQLEAAAAQMAMLLEMAEAGLSFQEVQALLGYAAENGAALSGLKLITDPAVLNAQMEAISAGIGSALSMDGGKVRSALQIYLKGPAATPQSTELVRRLAGIQQLQKDASSLSSGSSEEEKALSQIFSGLTDSLNEMDEDIIDAVFASEAAQNLVRKASAVSKDISEISSDGGAVAFQTARFINSARHLAGDMDELVGIMNAYYMDVQNAIANTDNALLAVQKASQDFALTLQTVNDTLRAASENFSNAADDGIEVGQLAVENAAKMIENTKNLKESGSDLRKSIRDELDEQEEENNFLNMDPDAVKLSFTSAMNQEPASVSIVCRTEEISAENKMQSILDAEIEEASMTPLQRIGRVFQTMWEAMLGWFRK